MTACKNGRDIDFSNAAIGNMLAGKTMPSFDFLSKLMELYPLVNANWLMMGRGEMFVDPNIKPRNNKLHSPDLLESKNEIIALLNEHVKMKDDKISQMTEELRVFRAAAKLLREKEDRASGKAKKGE